MDIDDKYIERAILKEGSKSPCVAVANATVSTIQLEAGAAYNFWSPEGQLLPDKTMTLKLFTGADPAPGDLAAPSAGNTLNDGAVLPADTRMRIKVLDQKTKLATLGSGWSGVLRLVRVY